jgi:ATP-binding cassette, subfamily B, bacterial
MTDRGGSWTRLRSASRLRSRADGTKRGSSKQLSLRSLLAPYLRRERKALVLLSVVSIVGGFAEAGVLVLIARIAFALADNASSVSVSFGPLPKLSVSVPDLLLTAAVLVIVRMGLQVIQTVIAARATYRTTNRVRKELVRSYLSAGWPLQSTQRDGRLQDLISSYAGATAGAVQGFTGMIVSGLNLLALLVAALLVNAPASIAAALAAMFVGVVLRPLRGAVRRRSGRNAAANHEFATGVTELTTTLQEVRTFRSEPAVRSRLDGMLDRATRTSLSTAYVSGVIPMLYQGIALGLIVLGLGINYAVGGSTLASVGAVVVIMLRILSYAQSLQSSVQGLHESAPYIETLHEEQERYDAAAVQSGGVAVDEIGTIEFDRVTFEYEPGNPVLRDVSFSVERGEIIGIVGPSGAGKSTLVQLLLRLREPTVGRIVSNGREVHEISLDSWYQHLSFVPQEARLLPGSVRDNIRFYRDSADDAAIERAAKLAHIHDDIMSWPHGYDTPVGERGGQLSGGQRQRLCIARALLDDPDVIVLDEPTSALDVKSESLMRDTLAGLAPRDTIFVIAHRLSTLSICDRIMVILDGELQGFEEPAKLETSSSFYREALRLSGIRG